MTITIADGRGALWQWDTGRRVKITDGDSVKQIHYQKRCFGRSVDVDVRDDGTAIIPDELLQDYHTLTAYAYVTDDAGGYTKVQQDFAVYKRPKPSDYVYTPTEHAGFDRLRAEIGELSALQTNAKNNLVAAINEAAASGGGVQPDWNQNDDTQPDYVKNRPFYNETKTVTVENVTDAKLEGFPAFVTGDTVNVNVDGVEHSLVAYYDEHEGVFTIGDIYSSIENGEGQLGWQFYSDGESYVYFYATEAHTIFYLGVFIYKIDDKFLNLDGLVRTFDYHFKDYALYKTLYNSAGDDCTLYTSSDFILPKPGSKLFGCMSELGFSIVDSVDLYSCFITGVKIDTINSRIRIVRVVLGANTSDMETMAADNGYTYTTNPNA